MPLCNRSLPVIRAQTLQLPQQPPLLLLETGVGRAVEEAWWMELRVPPCMGVGLCGLACG